jgi:YCII-related domain
MPYTLLIVEDPHQRDTRTEAEGHAVYDRMVQFAEAKEMVGGFFLLDCKTQAEAIAIAAECPAAQWCTVAVREVGPCFT